MMDALHHRGPDGEGEYTAPHVHLGMRRLSIIDLTGGWQPLFNEDRSLVLIANGEIYNFIELRGQLIERGHEFRTHSDCEVILHLYEEQEMECLHQLRGMFAFALWDVNRRRLVLARDRMGEKPLYLYEQDGQLFFASEFKSLLRGGAVPFTLNPPAINNYFHYGYVPEPLTPIEGVRKLPAGHFMILDLEGWQRREVCYWKMEDAVPLDDNPGDLIRRELDTVSEIIVRSDVPVGVALSGGLDSSAIAALAAKKYPGTIQAFSVGYPHYPRGDERVQAREFAEYLKIPFHEVELDTTQLVSFFPQLILWQDDPIADIAGFGYYAVMRLAREHGVPVILQGHGGDELFWGYPWARRAVQETMRKADISQITSSSFLKYLRLRAPKSLTAGGVIDWIRDQGGIKSSIAGYFRDLRNSPEQMVFYDLSPDFRVAQEEAFGLFSPSFNERLLDSSPMDIFSIPRPWPPIETTITRLLCQTYLLENGVAQGDRLSMASSVELRLPLLDYKLVETVIGLRKRRPDSHLAPKAWLKEALSDVLPSWVVNRPKRGFAPPVRLWHNSIFSAHGASLDGGVLTEQEVLSQAAGRDLSRGAFPYGITAPLSFKALVLELWCRNFIG